MYSIVKILSAFYFQYLTEVFNSLRYASYIGAEMVAIAIYRDQHNKAPWTLCVGFYQFVFQNNLYWL